MDVTEITGKREEQKVHPLHPAAASPAQTHALILSAISALVFCPEGDRVSTSFFHVGEEEKRGDRSLLLPALRPPLAPSLPLRPLIPRPRGGGAIGWRMDDGLLAVGRSGLMASILLPSGGLSLSVRIDGLSEERETEGGRKATCQS